jgi:lysophospholipase L1-like esterase
VEQHGAAGTDGSGGSGGSTNNTGGGSNTAGSGNSSTTGGSSNTGTEDGTVAAGVRWVGRVDTTDAAKPKFGWGSSGFVANFTGTSVGVNMYNDNGVFFQAVVDGQVGKRFPAVKGTATVNIASGLSSGSHTLELYRETEAFGGVSQLIGITEGTLGAPPKYSGRLIEVIGDSSSNGYGELGDEQHPNYCSTTTNACGYTYDTQSGYLVYGALTARDLNADWSIIAVSGWGLSRDLGGGTANVLPSVYTGSYMNGPAWTFGVKADAVVINLGTNDTAKGDPGAAFQTALSTFVDTIRSKYPDAWIFPVAGDMMQDAARQQISGYMQAVVTAKGGDSGKIAFLDLGAQDCTVGTGCEWHPSDTEMQRIADKLTPFIKQKLGW